MAFEQIRTARAGGVLTVELHRPDKLNAYTARMGAELTDAFEEADGDDAVRAVVVTGAGRAFCAGADLSGFQESQQGDSSKLFGDDRVREGTSFVEAIFRCRKPSIAAINGHAIGVGLTMTLPMDLRIAAGDARLAFPFARLGLVPEAGSAYFLPRLVGISQALRWCCSGRTFDADEALGAGLVSEVVTGDVAGRAREIAEEMTAYSSPVSVALTRRMLWGVTAEADLKRVLRYDGRLAKERAAGPDMKEGMAAMKEKRKPEFKTRISADMPPEYAIWED